MGGPKLAQSSRTAMSMARPVVTPNATMARARSWRSQRAPVCMLLGGTALRPQRILERA